TNGVDSPAANVALTSSADFHTRPGDMAAFLAPTLQTSLIAQAPSTAQGLPVAGPAFANVDLPARPSEFPSHCFAAVAAVASATYLSGPRRHGVGRRVPRLAFEYELGVQAPFGYWDPLGLAADGDLQDFRRRREVELKHGRVAMYATIGYIVPEFYKFPGYVSVSEDWELEFANVPNGLKACDAVPIEGWLQIIAYCGYLEIVVNQPMNPKEPGNYYRAGRFGANPLRIMADEDLRKRSLNAELANGRLAMVAIIGMFFQDGLTGPGQAWGDWALYTDSPLRSMMVS
ncbi:Light-harvesting complex, partial [Amphidinium carterae]